MKNIHSFLLGIAVFFIFSFSGTTQNKGAAEVDKIQGLYIFVKAKPVQEYEYLGTVEGATIGSHEFDKMLEKFISKVKKKHPEANALIFDSKIAQTHNTTVSAIRLEE